MKRTLMITLALLATLFAGGAMAQSLVWPKIFGEPAATPKKPAPKKAETKAAKRVVKKVARPNPAITKWERDGKPSPVSERLTEAVVPPKPWPVRCAYDEASVNGECVKVERPQPPAHSPTPAEAHDNGGGWWAPIGAILALAGIAVLGIFARGVMAARSGV